jgi:hypothetical protein
MRTGYVSALTNLHLGSISWRMICDGSMLNSPNATSKGCLYF